MATKANIKIDQGTDFITGIDITGEEFAVNLEGYTGASHIRKYYTSESFVPFDVTINTLTNVIYLGLDADTSNEMEPGRYVYDVELTDASGVISRILEGLVTITPGVTR